MSRAFYAALALIFLAFAVYELWLNLRLRAVNDDVVAACVKPARVPNVEDYAVFYFAPGQPISRSVMVR